MSENTVISSREARLDLWHGRFPAYTLFHMFVIFTNKVFGRLHAICKPKTGTLSNLVVTQNKGK